MPSSRARERLGRALVARQGLRAHWPGKELVIRPEGSGKPLLNLKSCMGLLELHFNEVH